MRRLGTFGLLVLMMILGQAASASVWVTWHMTQGTSHQGFLDFKIEEGWKIYSPKNTDETLRPQWTVLGQKNVENTVWAWPEPQDLQIGTQVVKGFQKSFRLPLTVQVKNPDRTSKLEGRLDFVACRETCVPLSVNVTWAYAGAHVVLWEILILAFLGGLVLNLMPCVLPVLSLKVFGLLSRSLSHAKDREKMAFTILGSLCFFLTFGVVIFVLRAFGESAGWGMHFQNPYFVAFFMWLLLVLSGRFLGLVSVASPDMSLPWIRSQRGRAFADGLMLAILATPCTAPYLSVASGIAMTLPLAQVFVIFGAIWAGFSLPYFILLISPQTLRRILPNPGRWMVRLEKILALLLVMTALWAAWVLAGQTHGWLALACLAFVSLMLIACAIKPSFQGRLLLISALVIFMPLLREKTDHTPWTVDLNHIEASARKGHITLIKIGAAWCLTCHANDAVLGLQPVQEALRDKKVSLISLDWTRRDPKIGEFLETFDRDGIPFCVVFGPKNPGGKVLPELLTTTSLLDAINTA